MEYQTFYSVSESPLSFGFWFSIIISSVFFLVGGLVIFKRPPEVIFGNNRTFHYIWGIVALILSSLLIYFLVNKVLSSYDDVTKGNYNVTIGKVTSFKFIKRNSDIAEFTVNENKRFKTSGIASQVPRSGLPIGTQLRIFYDIENNDILILEIEARQFVQITKQLEKYKYECFHYAKC